MPIVTKGSDILISFSYECPMVGNDLKLDFSLLYQDDVLVLRIKSGNKNLGIFPISMFQEILDFLSSKGYVDDSMSRGDQPKDSINSSRQVDDILNLISSESSDCSELRDSSGEGENSPSPLDSPIQSFSVNVKKSSSDNLHSGSGEESDDIVSVGRFRDDINYVTPDSVNIREKTSEVKGTPIKRTT